MTSATVTAFSQQTRRFAGWAAIMAGIAGLVALACLVTYLSTYVDTFLKTGIMPVEGARLLAAFDASGALQALLMIPVALALHEMGTRHIIASVALGIGCVGFLGIAMCRALTHVAPTVFSDILFMGPTALVGIWLFMICVLPNSILPLWLRLIGIVAALGLAIIGASFFFLGGIDVLTDGVDVYATNEPFHEGIGVGGPPGNIFFAIWAIIVGVRLLRASSS